MTVRWSANALGDLTSIRDYIAQHPPQSAQGVMDRIIQRADQLIHFPHLGSLVPEYNDSSIREVLEGRYRIIYQTDGVQVDILTVIHGARTLPPTPPTP